MSKRVGTTLNDQDAAWVDFRAAYERVDRATYIRKAIMEKINRRVPREITDSKWPPGYYDSNEDARNDGEDDQNVE
jgi:hypothetical protein